MKVTITIIVAPTFEGQAYPHSGPFPFVPKVNDGLATIDKKVGLPTAKTGHFISFEDRL
jgi:hypothetical protein